MSAYYDVDNDNARFLLIFRRVMSMFAVLIAIYLIVSTDAILKSNPIYLHDWRGAVCILLTAVVFLLYVIPIFMSMKLVWPVSWYVAVSIWGAMYLAVFLLHLSIERFSGTSISFFL